MWPSAGVADDNENRSRRADTGRAAWAGAYWWLGALDSFTDASVYALATMTTFEIPGLTLPSRFQMISALEAVNGVLLFGISTAFLFAVIQVHWQSLSQVDGVRETRIRARVDRHKPDRLREIPNMIGHIGVPTDTNGRMIIDAGDTCRIPQSRRTPLPDNSRSHESGAPDRRPDSVAHSRT